MDKPQNRSFKLTTDQIEQWETQGYLIVSGLWSPDEVASTREHFERWGDRPPIDDHWEPDFDATEPLRRYPRILHPHRFDERSRQMLLDDRVGQVLATLMGEEPIATQSMFYFKPPGGKGQALHQDNLYLKVRPQTCVAAWTAIDPAIPENGGLYVCPGTQDLELQCPELANPEESFTTHFVRPPGGSDPVPAILNPGDVLFFNGSVIHGSRPNASKNQWRRSFICHYAPASAREIAAFYEPCLRFDGREHRDFAATQAGGPCGETFAEFWPPENFDTALKAGLEPVTHGSIPGQS